MCSPFFNWISRCLDGGRDRDSPERVAGGAGERPPDDPALRCCAEDPPTTAQRVYQGLLKIGIETVRRPCVDQMEHIFERTPAARKRLDSTDGVNQLDGVSEDSDHSRRLSVSYEGDDNAESKAISTANNGSRREENENQRPRVRFFQRRMNLQGLVRVMAAQQRSMLERFDKLLKSLEDSNSKLVTLMENMVLNKTEPLAITQSDEKVADSA
ncbi:uncharacterized protein CEXT_113861 [Caerostris extrusa]|uniref:Uncharacterized protein n=1 Tax=Caerostris extrusa TaxID=172846 RepID=A0AAV4RAZ2_CAEEX|nr:uncharacterized protein CEXT_113861 [Caerostris extrusa]